MATPVTRYVDPDATGANDGTSWEDAYTGLGIWDEAEESDITASTGADEIHYVYARSSEGTVDDTYCEIDSAWKTESGNSINIIVLIANRHTGVRGTGFRICTDGAWESGLAVYTTTDCFININGLSISSDNTESQPCLKLTDDIKGVVENCLLYDGLNGNGLVCVNSVEDGSGKLVIRNCISVNQGDSGFRCGTVDLLHCAAGTNTLYGIFAQAWRTITAKNCYSGGTITDADYKKETGDAYINCTTCFDEDAGGIANSTAAYSTSAGAYFANVTGGTENLHINNAGSSLIEAGTGGICTYDIEDETRDVSSPDVGADEFTTGAGNAGIMTCNTGFWGSVF